MTVALYSQTDEARDHKRGNAVRDTGLIGGKRNPAFDTITRLLIRTFDCQFAYLSLIDEDRQWFLSSQGMGEQDSRSRQSTICNHVLESETPLFIRNAITDARFCNHPNVRPADGLRAYIGFPIRLPSGLTVGSVCVGDTRVAHFTEGQVETLGLVAVLAEEAIAAQTLKSALKSTRHAVAVRDNRILTRERMIAHTEQIAGIGTWDVSVDLQTLHWSQGTYDLHEVPCDTKVTVANAIYFYAEEDRELVSASLYKAMTEKSGFRFEARILTGSGQTKKVVSIGEYIPGNAEIGDRIVGVIREIKD